VGGQESEEVRSRAAEEEAEQPSPRGDLADRKEQLDADVDSLLEEIDDILEENAEEFVRGFVQKGGQ
jgi:ubiquitin-like protein Pup